MDESRFGLLTIARRCLTIKGVKPLVPYQHKFKNFYLYGAYSPVDGDGYTLEFPYCNTDCFEQYLEYFSLHRPKEFKILLVDNAAFHKAKRLKIPDNITLLFQPPYCPELNPAEMIWQHLKKLLANKTPDTLKTLSEKIANLIKNLSAETIKSITGWEIYTNCIN